MAQSARKSEALARFAKALEVEMKSRRLMTLDEMYEFVASNFPAEVSEFDRPLESRKTSEWKNLVDWVKAHWTKRRQTIKVGQWYVWIPACGIVGSQILADHSEALRTARKIAERLN